MSELSPRARALLDAARDGDDPTTDEAARVRGAIAARLAIGVAAGAAVSTAAKTAAGATAATVGTTATVGGGATTTATSVGLGLGTKVLLSVALVGAVGMGTISYVDANRASAPPPPVVATVAPRVTAAAPAAPPRAIAAPHAATSAIAADEDGIPTVADEPAPLAPPKPAATAPLASAPKAIASAGDDGVDAISNEVALIRDAHAALQSGDAMRALALLDEHARRFPAGALGEEREATRVLALCQLGRTGDARAAADRFLRVFPHSLQAPRVRASCGGAPSP